MSLNDETANILKIGTAIGLSIMAIGLVLSSLDFSETILAIGTLILIFTPVAGIGVSTKCLILEKDGYWVKIAMMLIAVIVMGSLISFFT